MTYRMLIAGPLVALAIGTGAQTAAAAPGGMLSDIGSGESLVTRTHGCHRSCEWGPYLRWHRHVGPGCVPVGCFPRAPFPDRCWIDGWGVRHCRW
jgi:hypothetical protein